ncbi:MAG: O-methyltransferase [Gemmatimonadetes bacterium]|nr:O-methyltransferase [Gemmatimonadota bacterium]MYF15897.1 O-methyltransferase [Gemmatimonadota bacterium]
MQQSYPDLDTYKREVFAREDDLLKNIMPDAAEQGIPRISVSSEAGQTLYLLARTIGAKKILEFGALAGYSGIWLARALPEDGQFITLEIEPKHADVTRRNYEKAGLSDRTDVRLGDGTKLMQDAVQDGPFDLIFIDADKESYPKYLDFALENTRPGGLIIADNANGHGHAHRALPEGDGRRGIQDYNRRVANHPQLISNIIPVGGWLAVSLVLE